MTADGEATVYELPFVTSKDGPVVDPTHCPKGHKRLRRLFNRIQISTTGHRVAEFIDPRLGPQSDLHATEVAKAKSFEKKLATAKDKTWELASPDERRQIAPVAAPGTPLVQPMNATAAFASIDPAARRDSLNHTWPMVKRNVVPLWERARA